MSHRIDPKTVRYFESRTDIFLKKCSADEKEDFILNTFAEVNREGWFICTNAKVCSSLEKLMPHANVTAIGIILKAFSKDLDSVFNTKFAHHVLHAAVKRCIEVEVRNDELVSAYLADYLEHMWENYPIYMHQPHSAPALRTYLQLMTGVSFSKSKHTGTYDLASVALSDPLDPSYSDRLTDLVNRILLSSEFDTFVVDAITCPLLQCLLIVCSKRLEDNFDAICSHILKKSVLLKPSEADTLAVSAEQSVNLPVGFSNPVAVFFMELIIQLLPPKLFLKFVRKNLLAVEFPASSVEEGSAGQPRSLVSVLAGHSVACRILRAVVLSFKKSLDLEAFLKALTLPGSNSFSGLRQALDCGQHYLLTALSAACLRLPTEQVQFAFEKSVLEAFGYTLKVKQHDSRFVRSLVSLRSLEDLEESAKQDNAATSPKNSTSDVVGNVDDDVEEVEEKDQVITSESPAYLPFKPQRPLQLDGTGLKTLNLTGCLLAEDMLMFALRRPIRLASSLVTLSPQEFYAWSRHYMLHRVIETALTSPAVPVERKRQIYTILTPQLPTLAFDACGSRVVEAVWKASANFPDVRAVREEMAKTFSQCSDRLNTSKYGRFVEKLVSSRAYIDNPARWRATKLPAEQKKAASNPAQKKRPHNNSSKSVPQKRPK
ncbi:Nucleolar protein 9 [Sparganum proliferum]